MSVSQGVFIVFCDGFVELRVFFLLDFFFWSEPNGFGVVDEFPGPNCLCDGLLLGLFGLFLFFFFLLLVIIWLFGDFYVLLLSFFFFFNLL